MDWIDNADSYICPVCRYETNNPLDNNACCPKCGFIPDRFQTPAKPEYIERQKTIDVIRRRCAPCGEGIEAIISVPTADVTPVVHGEWEQDEHTIQCSLCGFGMFPLFSFQDGEVAHGEFIPYYCPNCGAKMDGGVGDAAD